MFVTSAAEVLFPRLADFFLMFLNQPKRQRQASRAQAMIRCQLDLRIEPELGFPAMSLDVNVSSRLFPREEVESQPSLGEDRDRKSTRLNSSHSQISYAVFCLKKKKAKELS